MAMSGRVRKAIGSFVIVVFMLLYIGVAASIGGHMPDNYAIRLLYYAVFGTAWSLPLIPVVIWMNKGR
jgi:hypothetical protein